MRSSYQDFHRGSHWPSRRLGQSRLALRCRAFLRYWAVNVRSHRDQQRYKSGVEHTALGTWGMPPLYGVSEATYGGLVAGPRLKSLESAASMVRGRVWVNCSLKAGPSGKKQDRTHPLLHGPQ